MMFEAARCSRVAARNTTFVETLCRLDNAKAGTVRRGRGTSGPRTFMRKQLRPPNGLATDRLTTTNNIHLTCFLPEHGHVVPARSRPVNSKLKELKQAGSFEMLVINITINGIDVLVSTTFFLLFTRCRNTT
jgi:hypothetical protein